MEAIARVQSVKSSNAIEGIITTDKRVSEIVNNDSSPLNHNEEEIAGYRDALNIIHNGYKDISFTESTVLELHKVLMKRTGDSLAGRYKTEDNYIIETDNTGNRTVRFTSVSARNRSGNGAAHACLQ